MLYLINECNLDVFERNNAGETPMSIYEAKGYKDGFDMLEKLWKKFDKTV